MKSALTVSWGEREVGTLHLDAHGDMSFIYNAAWLADAKSPPLSISLPKQSAPFNRKRTRPFFAGLLPEEAQREAIARYLGLSKGNDYALLQALGGDVAGALTLWPEGETPPAVTGAQATEPLGDNALADLIDTLPERPLLAGRAGIRVSLAGAQSKLPVVLVDNRVALPAPGQPTTHILKPGISKLEASTENEAFAMRLAAALALDVAPVEARKAGGRSYLLVTRYDRTTDAQGRVQRVHQEDFCQALGIAPELKYAAEGGPTLKRGFALVREATARPAVEVLKLLDGAIFNLIVGNADAHGKNFSLLHAASGTVLAPLYDLMCTAAYPQVSAKLAMKIGNAATLEAVTAKTWSLFASEAGLGLPFVRRRVGELANAAIERCAQTADTIAAMGFQKPALTPLADLVRERAARVATSAQTGKD